MKFRRPQFEDLTPAEQLNYGNGVGPDRFPETVRDFLTDKAGWFFTDASWRHHDFGYVIGGDEFDRWRCDWKFFLAMVKDAFTQKVLLLSPISIPLAISIAAAFFLSVLFVGWISFNYRDHYLTTEEARKAFLKNTRDKS